MYYGDEVAQAAYLEATTTIKNFDGEAPKTQYDNATANIMNFTKLNMRIYQQSKNLSEPTLVENRTLSYEILNRSNGELRQLINLGNASSLNFSSVEDHFYNDTKSASTYYSSFANIDLQINYEMIAKEIYVNYCEKSTTCVTYLDSDSTLINNLFIAGTMQTNEIMRRMRKTDPEHYSMLVDYYMSDSRDARVRVLFIDYFD